jgi:hypothetical protein
MCRQIVRIAVNPQESPAFKGLQDKLQLATLTETPSEQNGEIVDVRQRVERVPLGQGLDRLEAMLSEQIQDNKGQLQPRRHRRDHS